MQGNLNALGIILIPIFVIAVSCIWGTKPAKGKIIEASVCLFIILFLLVLIYTPYSYLRDFPFYQIIIPIFALLPIIIFVKKKLVTLFTVLILLLSPVGLVTHYSYVVDGTKYSNIKSDRVQIFYENQIKYIKTELSSITETDSNSYPEGWLSDSSLMSKIPESMKERIKRLKENKYGGHNPAITYKLWHSSITGIYGIKLLHPDLWYPGGKLSQDTIEGLSLKERIPYIRSDISYLLCPPLRL